MVPSSSTSRTGLRGIPGWVYYSQRNPVRGGMDADVLSRRERVRPFACVPGSEGVPEGSDRAAARRAIPGLQWLRGRREPLLRLRHLRPCVPDRRRRASVRRDIMANPIVTVEVYDFPVETECFSGG
ncbi:hypothetical protein emb_1c0707 [Coriobacteriaceae bacterium EMTCatB1]|nr:hypothetical protein emb_1c0707 [Coriobacteriaceae bacterium EMTCatB1]